MTDVPWVERIVAISIHPDSANREEIARLAAELLEARRLLSVMQNFIKSWAA